MKSSLFPPCEPLLNEVFGQSTPCFAQIATTGDKKCPEVRTVHVKLENGLLLFNTNSDSLKWEHLKQNPQLAGCLYDPKKRFQLRFKAKATLIDETGQDSKQKIREKSWNLFLDQFKAIYWDYYCNTYHKKESAGVCPIFVTALLDVFNWDLNWTDDLNWVKERRVYEFKSSQWTKVYEMNGA